MFTLLIEKTRKIGSKDKGKRKIPIKRKISKKEWEAGKKEGKYSVHPFIHPDTKEVVAHVRSKDTGKRYLAFYSGDSPQNFYEDLGDQYLEIKPEHSRQIIEKLRARGYKNLNPHPRKEIKAGGGERLERDWVGELYHQSDNPNLKVIKPQLTGKQWEQSKRLGFPSVWASSGNPEGTWGKYTYRVHPDDVKHFLSLQSGSEYVSRLPARVERVN